MQASGPVTARRASVTAATHASSSSQARSATGGCGRQGRGWAARVRPALVSERSGEACTRIRGRAGELRRACSSSAVHDAVAPCMQQQRRYPQPHRQHTLVAAFWRMATAAEARSRAHSSPSGSSDCDIRPMSSPQLGAASCGSVGGCGAAVRRRAAGQGRCRHASRPEGGACRRAAFAHPHLGSGALGGQGRV